MLAIREVEYIVANVIFNGYSYTALPRWKNVFSNELVILELNLDDTEKFSFL